MASAADIDGILGKYEKKKKPQDVAPEDIEAILGKYELPADLTGAQTAETVARSALEGLTLGISEPVISGLKAAGQEVFDPQSALRQGHGLSAIGADIGSKYEADVAERRRLEEAAPITAGLSEAAGAIVPAIFTGGAGAAKGVLAGANVAGRLARSAGGVGKAAAEAIPLVGKIPALGRMAGAAGEAGAAVAATEAAKRGVESATGFIKEGDEMPSLAEQAKSGALLGAKFQAVPEVAKLAGQAGKGLLSALGGVSVKEIDKYLAKTPMAGELKTFEDTKVALDSAIEQAQGKLQSKKADLADNIVAAVDALKDRVVSGSRSAYEVLGKAEGMVAKNNVLGAIDSAKKSLMVAGQAPVGESARGAFATLDKYAQTISALPDNIKFTEAKQILQQLDDDIAYVGRAGEFGDRASRLLSNVRNSLDAEVKAKVPEYKRMMEGVAGDTRALVELSRKFGKAEGNAKAIDRMLTPGGKFDLDALMALERSSGTSLSGQLGEIDALKQAASGLSPATSQKFLQSALSDKNIEVRKQLQGLSKLTDQQLVSLVDNLSTATPFGREFRQGSRNVNLWALVLGGVAGGVFDEGMTGGITGAIVGGVVDRYGPAMSKKILDGVGRIKGMPTIQKIDQALQDVPPEVREQLRRDFVRGIVTGDNSGTVLVPESQRTALKQDILNSAYVSNVDKARAVNDLNKSGQVSGALMGRLAVGDTPLTPALLYKPEDNQVPQVPMMPTLSPEMLRERFEGFKLRRDAEYS